MTGEEVHTRPEPIIPQKQSGWEGMEKKRSKILRQNGINIFVSQLKSFKSHGDPTQQSYIQKIKSRKNTASLMKQSVNIKLISFSTNYRR